MAAIRPAVLADAAALAAIYAPHVLHGTATFEEEPPGPDEMAARLAAVAGRGWPWLVLEEDGCVLGYAYVAQFRDRAAYRFSCEDSIYLAPQALGRGHGGRLLDALLEASRAAGFRRMFAVIGDSANTASIALHARRGFAHAGRFDRAGHKFGRDLDIVFMQREM